MAKGGCSALSRRTSAVGQKADLRALMSGFRSIASATPRRADPALKARFRRLLVESGCGAVAVGSTYLFPPLSSGGASISEGFSHFVTSMTAPDASGWSDGRVGLAPTGKAPPYHGAHPLRTLEERPLVRLR